MTGASWSPCSSRSPRSARSTTSTVLERAPRDRAGHGHRHRAAAVRRRVRQVGPAAAVRVAARRHGRPDAGVGAHPRRHDGDLRRLPDDPGQPDPRPGLRLGARRHRLGRRAHRAVRGHHRRRPERHQEGAGLLDGQPARLHVPGRRLGRLRRRHLPHGHPRLLQGAAVPRLGLGHPRHARRAGHAPHGRPAASSCRSRPATFIVGWLAIAGVPPFAGFWSKDEILLVRLRQEPGAVGGRPGHRAAHRVLHEPPGLHGLLRRGALARRAGRRRGRPTRSPPARVAVADDAAARRAGRPRRRRRRAQPALHRRHSSSSSTGSSRSLEGNERRTSTSPPAPRSAWPSSPCSPASSASRSAVPRVPAAARSSRSSPRSSPRAGGYDSTIAAFIGGPGRQAFEATAAFDRTVIDGAVNGVGRRRARAAAAGLRAHPDRLRPHATPSASPSASSPSSPTSSLG